MKGNQRIFIGGVDPIDSQVQAPEIVCERVLEATLFISLQQLGTTDDCGFRPFADDTSTPGKVCYDTVPARIQGTKLTEQILNQQ